MDENQPADHQSHADSDDSGERTAHIFDDPRNVKRVIGGLVVVSLVLIALDLVLHRHLSFSPGSFPAEGWFGFYAIYGFVACVLLVLVAKEMRKLLMRGEDYYDR
jgi:hypothetical protein